MSADAYRDPDLLDPDQVPAPRAPEAPQSVSQKIPDRALVRRGSFDDGWTDLIKTLAGTLTDEQMALLMVRFEQLRGSSGK